jgi:hypothetical protein
MGMHVLVALCTALALEPAKTAKTTAIETMALGSELSVASQGGGLSPNFCTPLTNNDGIVYTTYVGIGSPPQHISVVPDTGSYVLAVTSTNCGDEACRAHNRFAPEKSSTDIKVESNVFLLQYGQGAITVRDTMEKVSFFGAKSSTDTINDPEVVSLALIQNETLIGFEYAPYDGIMGLGKRKKTELKDTAFLQDMKIESFTLCMGDAKLTGDGIGGRLDMQSMLAVGNEYKPLETIGEHVWGAVLDHVGVPGQPGARLCSGPSAAGTGMPCATIIDSGTTLLTFPKEVVDTLYHSIEAGCAEHDCLMTLQKQETCSGPHFDALPNLELRVGGQDIVLPPRVYMGEMEVDIPTADKIKMGMFDVYMPEYTHGIRCVPLLSALDEMTMAGPMSILGMPFLRQYAVFFNRESWEMSVAQIQAGSHVCTRCGAPLSDAEVTKVMMAAAEEHAAAAAAAAADTSSSATQEHLAARSALLPSALLAGQLLPGAGALLPALPAWATGVGMSTGDPEIRPAAAAVADITAADISGSADTATSKGHLTEASALQPGALLPETGNELSLLPALPSAVGTSTDGPEMRRAAPMKMSQLRGPSLHGVPTMMMPILPRDAFENGIPPELFKMKKMMVSDDSANFTKVWII